MKTKAKKAAATTQARAFHYDVIQSPVITEKSTAASEQDKVIFNVNMDATKADIKAAVEALFNIKVEKVNTLRRLGKQKRFRNTLGKKSDVKRAIITLVKGQNIDINTGVK